MWNDIEILVNDDTTREQLSVGLGHECGSALYQVDSLLQITSSEKVEFLRATSCFFTYARNVVIYLKCFSYYV